MDKAGHGVESGRAVLQSSPGPGDSAPLQLPILSSVDFLIQVSGVLFGSALSQNNIKNHLVSTIILA